jgi:hypothetical protein
VKLYHLSQNERTGYDTFSDMVVCAESEEEARNIHPSHWNDDPWKEDMYGVWCKSPDRVEVKYLGEAADDLEKGVICSSFHAG